MTEQKYEFRQLECRDVRKVILPGALLNRAKSEPIEIPLEDGGMVSLTDTPWYDNESISGHDGGVYGSIERLNFDSHVSYIVYYTIGYIQSYMRAIRNPQYLS